MIPFDKNRDVLCTLPKFGNRILYYVLNSKGSVLMRSWSQIALGIRIAFLEICFNGATTILFVAYLIHKLISRTQGWEVKYLPCISPRITAVNRVNFFNFIFFALTWSIAYT